MTGTDEIQECPEALNSLKYYREKANEYHVIAAGSLLGTLLSKSKSYPVGMVNLLDVFPLGFDEFNGPRGDFYKKMFAKCPAGRPGTADEMANIAELLMRGNTSIVAEMIAGETGADLFEILPTGKQLVPFSTHTDDLRRQVVPHPVAVRAV